VIESIYILHASASLKHAACKHLEKLQTFTEFKHSKSDSAYKNIKVILPRGKKCKNVTL
jgi:hypothetical protein